MEEEDAFTGARVAAAVGAEVGVIESCFGRNALLSSAHVLAVGCVGAQFLSTCTCPDGSGRTVVLRRDRGFIDKVH